MRSFINVARSSTFLPHYIYYAVVVAAITVVIVAVVILLLAAVVIEIIVEVTVVLTPDVEKVFEPHAVYERWT